MLSDKITYCPGCMHPMEADTSCRFCDFSIDTYTISPRCLRPGTLLQDRYLTGRVLGEGSFGITYIGKDLLLGITIAIKEYFPISLASRDVRKELDNTIYTFQNKEENLYTKGREQFYNEARILSQFHELHGIVTVRDFFDANETAYLIMDYISGRTLKNYIKESGPLSAEKSLLLMEPVIKDLAEVHNAGIIHRDISPDNLILTEDEKLVLIDFGSARIENKSLTKSLTVMFKRGYTPEEQYRSHGKQGPWSDIYSLCATLYFMMTGEVPRESIERMISDNLPSLLDKPEITLTASQKKMIMKGMSVKAKDRPQDMQVFWSGLYTDSQKKGTFSIVYALLCICCMTVFFLLLPHLDKANSNLPTVSPTPVYSPAADSTADAVQEKVTSVSPSPAVSDTVPLRKMPSFKIMNRKEAKKKLLALEDSELRIKWKFSYSRKYKKGMIFKQSIPANTLYHSGDYKKLVLTISKGAKPAATPVPTPTPSPSPTATPAASVPSTPPDDDFVGKIP